MASEHIYGINPAFEVLRAGRRKINQAWIAAESAGNPRLRKLRARLSAAGVAVQTDRRAQLARLGGSSEHQGVVLSVGPYPYVALDELLAMDRLLLLDNVEDPQNVGAILRSAEVLGWHGVLLARKGVPPVYPSVVRASAGAVEHLRVCRELTANDYVRRTAAAGFATAVLDVSGRTDPLEFAARRPARLLLVIGGEHCGVGRFIVNQAQTVLGIPQHGRVGSLNASVAAGIVLFALAIGCNQGPPMHPAAAESM